MLGFPRTIFSIVLSFAVLSGLLMGKALSAATTTHGGPADLPTLVIMDFSIKGDLEGFNLEETYNERLGMASKKLRDELAQQQLYNIVGTCATALCASDEVRKLDADYIAKPWVYRISALVLTLHVLIQDTETGDTVLRKSVDFRGDNDIGWARAIEAFVRNMKREEQA